MTNAARSPTRQKTSWWQDASSNSKTTATGSNITTATAAVANNIHTISRAVILAEAAVDSSLSHNAGLYPPRLCGRSCQPLDQSFPGLLNKCSSSNRETLQPPQLLRRPRQPFTNKRPSLRLWLPLGNIRGNDLTMLLCRDARAVKMVSSTGAAGTLARAAAPTKTTNRGTQNTISKARAEEWVGHSSRRGSKRLSQNSPSYSNLGLSACIQPPLLQPRP